MSLPSPQRERGEPRDAKDGASATLPVSSLVVHNLPPALAQHLQQHAPLDLHLRLPGDAAPTLPPLSPATSSASSEAAARNRNDALDDSVHRSLYRASLHLNAISSAEVFLRAVSEELRQLTSSSFCYVYKCEATPPVLELASGDGEKRRLPWSRGITGLVASTGKRMVVQNAEYHASFDAEVDSPDSHPAGNILCFPILDADDSPYLVITLLRVCQSNAYTKANETICALLAPHILQSWRRCRHDQALVAVASNLIKEMDPKRLMLLIMKEARRIGESDRCSLFLLDESTNELVAEVFDVNDDFDESKLPPVSIGTKPPPPPAAGAPAPPKPIRFPKNVGLAGQVATSGKALIINNPYEDGRFNRDVDVQTGYRTHNLLVMPIMANGNCVGVAELLNKRGGRLYTNDDVALLEPFVTFCGIAILNSKLFHQSRQAELRAKVALDLIAYHATPHPDEVAKYLQDPQVSPMLVYPDFDSVYFDTLLASDEEACRLTIFMVQRLGFMQQFNVPREPLARFVLAVRKGYRNVAYHNWQHAFAVTHYFYSLVKTCDLGKFYSQLELFAIFLACLCHDIDHRGKNNAFQNLENNTLAQLYGYSSVLEKHHFAHAVTLLNTEGNNLLKHLPDKEYSRVIEVMRHAILSTDLANHFKSRAALKALGDKGPGIDPQSQSEKDLVSAAIMTCSDVCAIAKPWSVSRVVAKSIYAEFFDQGDEEKRLDSKPIPMMDRDVANIPKLQTEFIDFIVLPAFNILSAILPGVIKSVDAVKDNRAHWQALYEYSQKTPQSNAGPLGPYWYLDMDDV